MESSLEFVAEKPSSGGFSGLIKLYMSPLCLRGGGVSHIRPFSQLTCATWHFHIQFFIQMFSDACSLMYKWTNLMMSTNIVTNFSWNILLLLSLLLIKMYNKSHVLMHYAFSTPQRTISVSLIGCCSVLLLCLQTVPLTLTQILRTKP